MTCYGSHVMAASATLPRHGSPSGLRRRPRPGRRSPFSSTSPRTRRTRPARRRPGTSIALPVLPLVCDQHRVEVSSFAGTWRIPRCRPDLTVATRSGLGCTPSPHRTHSPHLTARTHRWGTFEPRSKFGHRPRPKTPNYNFSDGARCPANNTGCGHHWQVKTQPPLSAAGAVRV